MKTSHLLLASCLAVVACHPGPQADSQSPAVLAESAEYRAEGFVALSLPELSDAVATGETTSLALTQAYLDRIDAVDRNGPRLQSVLSLNPDALDQAMASDARRAAGEARGPLDGLPILLKDNIESLDPLATTAGSYALHENITGRDSPLVAGLRAQGAVILG